MWSIVHWFVTVRVIVVEVIHSIMLPVATAAAMVMSSGDYCRDISSNPVARTEIVSQDTDRRSSEEVQAAYAARIMEEGILHGHGHGDGHGEASDDDDDSDWIGGSSDDDDHTVDDGSSDDGDEAVLGAIRDTLHESDMEDTGSLYAGTIRTWPCQMHSPASDVEPQQDGSDTSSSHWGTHVDPGPARIMFQQQQQQLDNEIQSFVGCRECGLLFEGACSPMACRRCSGTDIVPITSMEWSKFQLTQQRPHQHASPLQRTKRTRLTSVDSANSDLSFAGSSLRSDISRDRFVSDCNHDTTDDDRPDPDLV